MNSVAAAPDRARHRSRPGISLGAVGVAAVSIPSNIAEDAGRSGNKEFTQFLYIAVGSASELDTQIEIFKEAGLGDLETLTKLQNDLGIVTKMLYRLIRATSTKS